MQKAPLAESWRVWRSSCASDPRDSARVRLPPIGRSSAHTQLCCVFTPAIVSLHRSPALLEVSPLVSLVLGEVGLLDPLRHVSAHERARGARHGRARESARSTSKEITSSLSIGKPSMTPLWG